MLSYLTNLELSGLIRTQMVTLSADAFINIVEEFNTKNYSFLLSMTERNLINIKLSDARSWRMSVYLDITILDKLLAVARLHSGSVLSRVDNLSIVSLAGGEMGYG